MNKQKISLLLFVYGTLLPEVVAPEIRPIVKSLDSFGKGYVRGRLFDLGNYPGAIFDESGYWIVGHIYRLPEFSLVKFFDMHEDYDPNDCDASLFIREIISVQTHEGKVIDCWTYTYNQTTSLFPQIECGDYLAYLRQKGKIL